MATIKDIAKDTGFSVTTVSRALNGYSDVNEKTRAIIQASAKKLQYSPNVLAQSLVTKKSHTIGLLVSNLQRENEKDNIVFKMLCGVLAYVTDHNYEMILINTSSSQQRNKTFRQIINERNLDGTIIQGLRTDDPYLNEAINSDVPTVLIDIPVENETTGYVSTNQIESIKNAIKYLAKLGHQQIAFMTGHKYAYVSEIRQQAYQDALSELAIAFDEKLLCYGDFDEDKAYHVALELLLSNQDISAIMCASDVMALGALRAAKECALSVPEDLSIIGFDNILLTEYVHPTLTTVAQNVLKLGQVATKLLLEMIDNQTKQRHHILKNEFIIRESTGICKQRKSEQLKFITSVAKCKIVKTSL